jgi:Phosphoesterase family
VKSPFGRGDATTRKRSGTSRRFRLGAAGAALSASLLATLAFSVTAVADTPAAGTDLPTSSSAFNAAWAAAPTGYTAPANDGLGVSPGQIGHVWVIVLENHAYTSNFSPLEGTQNSYLEQLPSQGALLTHYYGTGHSSLDNYLSMVSGQAPQADVQDDCPSYDAMSGSIDASGTPATNADFGQFVDSAGADAPPGDNGCVFPSSVKTIFNQLDSAGETWKVYAQDLGNADNAQGTSFTHDAGTADCGAPDSTVAPAPTQSSVTDNPNPSSADATDQYVAKHNPLAWFYSMLPASMGGTGGSDCANNLAPLFGPNDQLFNDLQSDSTTPDLSYIVPNNCSNGHDAVCAGNNLSGGFENSGQGQQGQIPNPTSSDINSTGGTYSESLFLQHIIPEIEASPAFKDNGLIVVNYDEAYPPFTYSNDSQANSQLQAADAAGSLTNDSAGETLYGRSLNWEPTGPNATIVTSPIGQVLTAGPGDSADLDRPVAATGTASQGGLVQCVEPSLTHAGSQWIPFTTPTPTNGQCVPGFQANLMDLGSTFSNVTITSGSSTVPNVSATTENEGEQVTFSAGTPTLSDPANPSFNGNVYVGSVVDTPDQPTTSSGAADTGSFTLVDDNGNPVTVTGGYSGNLVAANVSTATDPFYDAYDATLGGGDSGAVLISPDITPGTVSNTFYNHYSLLRSLEDIFGITSGGVDGSGHLGFAAQPGLAPFGSDVFTNAETPASGTTVTNTVTATTPAATVTKTTPAVTTPGSTQTVEHTTTVRKSTTWALVPGLAGDTQTDAKKWLSKDELKLGKVTKPKGKLKKGDELVVASSKPAAAKREKTGTKVSLTLKAVAKSTKK